MEYISPQQACAQLKKIADFGRNEDGSYTRLCFAKEYFAALHAVQLEMESLGMNPQTDPVGNLHGVYAGSDHNAPKLVLGSHMDTVPCGGLFDGAFGVAAALCALHTLQKSGGVLRHPIELWGFNAEEANPMGGTFGSRAAVGLCAESEALCETLAAYGLTLQELRAARHDFSDGCCYLELHIEQGPTLDEEKIQIGAVSGIVGLWRYQITAHGQSNHAGTTRMKGRRDAMVGMAKLIVQATQAAGELDDALVLTVGTISLHPGNPAVIADEVSACFEIRHLDATVAQRMLCRINALAEQIPDAAFTIEPIVAKLPTRCDRRIVNCVQTACRQLGKSCLVMPSGATHDAVSMGQKLPTGMIFIPSRGGISHNGAEFSSNEALADGANTLLQTLLLLDEAF